MSIDDKNSGLGDWTESGLDWLDELMMKAEPEKAARTEAPERPIPAEPAPRRVSEERPPVRSRAPRSFETEEPVMRRTADGEPYPRRTQPTREHYERRVPPDDPPYRGNRRRGRGGGTNKLLIALIVLLGLGFLFAAFKLGSIFLNYRRDRSMYADLASNAIVALAEQDEESATTEVVHTETGERFVSEVPLSVDWSYLRSINSSIVGWLYCPDTVINYPVVQTSDHDLYLDHGFDGNANTSGTLFADRNSALGIEQSNYIIYGHNMKDESMFGTLKNYVNKSYYDEHPTMYYLTPNGSYRVDLVCAHIVEGTYDNLPGYFTTIGDYQTYLNEISSDSFWVNYDAITTEHQLLTLSTCTSAAGFNDARLLLHGMMVPIQ